MICAELLERPRPRRAPRARVPRRRASSSPTPATTSIRAASSDRQLLEVGGPAPLQRLDRLDHFERVADVAAERRVHRGDERLGAHAGRLADRDQRLGERAATPRGVFMNAPVPVLTSSTRPPMPSAIFLLMIDARDERDALDRAGDVAQRVELPVGRRDLARSGR